MAILDPKTRQQFEAVWNQTQDGQNVSRETFSKVMSNLELLVAETLKWQKAINLIAPKTVSDIWTRHILDSFQLIPFLPELDEGQGGLIDLGSGGGFPGMVLAAAGVGPIRMIDSDQRKGQFLAQTSRKLGLKADVITSRLEAYKGPKGQCLTARALAPLERLFGWAMPMLHDEGQLVLLKGEAWQEEIDQALKIFEFDVEVKPSQTHEEARILIVRNLALIEPRT